MKYSPLCLITGSDFNKEIFSENSLGDSFRRSVRFQRIESKRIKKAIEK